MKAISLESAVSKSISLSNGFSLVPIGAWILDDLETVDKMSSWRSTAKDSFFSQVDSSVDSMLWYLREYSIGDPNRILFLIRKGDSFLGHLGLSRVRTGRAEIDNVMKSQDKESTIQSAQFLTIFNEFIEWASVNLGISLFSLQVVSSNIPAIKLYRRAGFISMPSTFVEVNEDVSHSSYGDTQPVDDDASRLWMKRSIPKTHHI
jgi:RimJ/RimL family protein N-acetyltransferase